MTQAGQQLNADLQLALGQIEVNKIEAASSSFFKSGPRPAALWVCVGGLAYQLMGLPFTTWLSVNYFHFVPPPALDSNTLMTLLFGMLGLGAYRSFDKLKGTS